MVKRTLFTLALLSTLLPLWAGDITGKVIDGGSRQPIDFANVSITRVNDSIPLTGVTTNEDGSFLLTDIKKGTYILHVSFMGYKETQKTIDVNTETINIGKIILREDTRSLQEVEVVAQGSTMRFELDKKVFTVDQNMANAGASVTDALANIPSVDVNEQEGTISLRNSEDVVVWINGKPAGLTAENRADILKMMPAESIKEIEIITNPSAKYSPEGTAGIINLVTKKNRQAGYYGSVSLDLSYALAKPWNIPPGGRLGFNLNFNKGIVEGYVSMGYNRNFSNGSSKSDRYNFSKGTGPEGKDEIERLIKDGQNKHDHGGMYLRGGLDFHITERSTIGVSAFGMISAKDDKTNGWFSNQNNSPASYMMYRVDSFIGPQDENNKDTLINYYDRNQRGSGYNPGGNAMVDWRFEISKEHYLQMSAQYNQWNWNNDQFYTQLYHDIAQPDYPVMEEQTTHQEQLNANKDQSVQLKADYEWKPTQQSRLEAGWQTDLAWRNTYANAWNGQNREQQERLIFNDFTNNEQTHALYITYGNRFWDKFAVQVGLRGEYFKRHLSSDYYTANHADSLTTATQDTSYFQLFPSVYLSYDFGSGHELQLNYTRRIDRPRGHQINPRKDISDVTNISYGNPNLMPQYSSALELNYLKSWEMHTLSVEAFYRFTNGVTQRVNFMGPVDYAQRPVMYTTFTNLGKRHAAGLEVSAKDRFLQDKIQLTTSISGYYNRLDEAEYTPVLNGTELDKVILPMKNSFVFTANLTAQFLFTKTFSGQVRGRYSSPRVVAQGMSSHHYSIDLGLRKTFLDRKLALALNIRDLLNSRSRSNITEEEGVFWQWSENRWNSRTISLTVSYNFGNSQAKKPNKHQFSGDDSGMGGGFEDNSEY